MTFILLSVELSKNFTIADLCFVCNLYVIGGNHTFEVFLILRDRNAELKKCM